jgi:hypothetical protein
MMNRNYTDHELEHSRKGHKLRIATINVSTLRDREEEMVEMMMDRRLDILGMCETRRKGEGRKEIHNGYHIIWKGCAEAKHGVAFMVTPEIADRVTGTAWKNERMISMDVDLRELKVTLIQVYAPQQGRPVNEKDEFYQSLQELYENATNQENIVVLGDLNGHIGINREGIENIFGAHSIGNKNPEGERIIDFCVFNTLAIMNTFYNHRPSHKWTWYRWNNAVQEYTDRSMIDFILTNNKRIFTDVKAVPSVSCDSDHRMVVAVIKVKRPEIRAKRKNRRYLLENLKKQNNTEKLREAVRQRMQGEPQVEDVEDGWRFMKETIKGAAEEVIGSKVSGCTKKKTTAWWTEAVREAVKNKMKKFRIWMKTRRQEDRDGYVEARNEAERIKRDSKTATWQRIGEELERDIHGTGN